MVFKTICFTAFNINTGNREAFECPFISSCEVDAATSKLWYGECWSRAQMASADIKIIVEEPRCSKTADAAWFIIRTADTLDGIRSRVVANYLVNSCPSRIESDAEQIQEDMAFHAANTVQRVMVGRLIHESVDIPPFTL